MHRQRNWLTGTCSFPIMPRSQGPGAALPGAPPHVRSSLSATQESQNSQDQEHKEQHLRNAGCTRGKTAEAQNRGNDCNNEKYDCVVKHLVLLPPPRDPCVALCGHARRKSDLTLSEAYPVLCKTVLTPPPWLFSVPVGP